MPAATASKPSKATPVFEWSLGPDRKPFRSQIVMAEFAASRRQAALFAEMGLAKTAACLNIMEHHIKAGRITAGLILCPLSIVDTWIDEIKRCLPHRTWMDLSGKGGADRRKFINGGQRADFYLVNYEAIGDVRDKLSWLGEQIYDVLSKTRFAMACDESTAIKNVFAARTKGAIVLGEEAVYRYLLSGTPCPQGPIDIFGQYAFLDPAVFGPSFVTFRTKFFVCHPVWKSQVIGLRAGMEKEFMEAFHSLCTVLKKEQFSDLPPKLYETRYYKLDGKQKTFYETLAKEWVAELEAGKVTTSNALVKSLRLGQVCTGFVGGHVDDEDAPVELEFKEQPKLKLLKEILEEVPGKVIVWCAWRHNVKQVLSLCKVLGVKAVDYTGDTPDRTANQRAFRESGDIKVFCGTGAAGGMGIDLSGPDVKTVVYYSQDYKVLTRQQSEDRPHRGTIKHNVTVIDLVAKGTVEVDIVAALRKGIKLQDHILKDPSRFTKGGGEL